MFFKMKCAKIFVFLFVGMVVQCWAMSLSELEDFANFLKKTSQLDETLKKGTDTNEFDEDDAVSDHAWEESGKFEGDLILNDKQRRNLVEDVAEGLSRNGLQDSTKRWPDNEVVYYIQKEHFSGDQIQAIQSGIDDLAQASCVKFRPYRKGDRDAVVIQGSRRGCFSQVGYQGGYQVLNLSGRHPVGRGCFRHGTVVHELLHTLGFYHMQSSPDRDDYVDIVWENIVQPARHNFRKYNAFSVSDFGVGYDYDSVLHYSKRAFSSNGQDTIVPKQGGAQIGQRVGLSDKDAQKLNKMYCDAGSNDAGDDNVPLKFPHKKKNPKNKPFEGHGIGYHQGKTVVIKLLPAAETYNIMNKPAYPMFNYFSKAPQVLSTEKIEGLGSGRGIAESYKPYVYAGVYDVQPYKKVQDIIGYKTISTNKNDNSKEITETKDETSKSENKEQENPENEKEHKTSEDVTDTDLNEALKRLVKILKTHVYPTNIPDLKVYQVNTDYSEFEDPNKVPKIAYDFIPGSAKEELGERLSSDSEYIKSLYRSGPNSLKHDKQEINVDPDKASKIVNESTSAEVIENNDETNKEGENGNPDVEAPQSTIGKLQNPKEMYEIVVSQNEKVPKEAEAAYRTTYPFKVHQIISNGSLEIRTPEYASYDNLKHKDNYSDLYKPYTDGNEEITKRKYTLLGDPVPTYAKWDQKDYLKRNPVDYDRPSYTDTYDLPNSKSDIRIYDASESSEHDPSSESEYTGSFSPQTRQAYTLYGEPVPLSQNWYKVNSQKLIEYPYKHYQAEDSSESHDDNR